jgi:fibrillarin-like pre-rRNA processing protein
MKKLKFPNLYLDKKSRHPKLFTVNLIPGEKYFDEDLKKLDTKFLGHRKNEIFSSDFKKIQGLELRHFDAKRSKLAAAIVKDVSQIGIKEDSKVLYLGASHGYTCSFLSDMVNNGIIFALDFAPRVVRDLIFLTQKRKNLIPIMADANQPRTYAHRIFPVDIVFMDVAQKNQTEIFLKNCDQFLKEGGFGLFSVKSRSIDITKKPKKIYQEVRAELEKHVTIVDFRILDPYEKDHCIFVIKK